MPFHFFVSELAQQSCVLAVLGAPNAVAVHLFKNWWGGFDVSSAEVEHATEDTGKGPYGTGPYGTGPYALGLGSGNISFVSQPWSEDIAAWLLSPACKSSRDFSTSCKP